MDSCQELSQGFVASKQFQTSSAPPQSRILMGAGKANAGAKVGRGGLFPVGSTGEGSPAPGPALLLTHGAMETNPAEHLNFSTHSSRTEGQD